LRKNALDLIRRGYSAQAIRIPVAVVSGEFMQLGKASFALVVWAAFCTQSAMAQGKFGPAETEAGVKIAAGELDGALKVTAPFAAKTKR
jgi:hypothetical protein